MSLGRGNEEYLRRIYHLLYKHQCFVRNSATEKIQIFSHIATCTFVVIRRGSFSIAREFAKEVSSHSLFLGCFPVIVKLPAKMAERFVTFDITEVEEFINNVENSNTRRKTKNNMVLLRSFMAKEKENRQFEEILPQELDNYLSRILLSVRKKNGDEYEPPTLD